MNKRKPLKQGDIVTLKPIALLIAEKQIRFQEKSTRLGRFYIGSPYVNEEMVQQWNKKLTVEFINQYGDILVEENHHGYSQSWIKSVKRAK